MTNKPYIVILAGGVGSRFWPYSRRKKPKQFLDILGTGRTLLQMTYDRYREMADPEQFVVVTYKKYQNLVKKQLPELKDEQVLVEPMRKNTAVCMAYACFHIHSKDPDSTLVVTPSDHLILQESKYIKTIQRAVSVAEREGKLLTIGVKPTRAETNYGYIQYLEKPKAHAFKVKTFTEKPNAKLAKTFLESGDFAWNSGMFVWKSKTLIRELHEHLPDLAEIFEEGKGVYGTAGEEAFVRRAYSQVKNISFDIGIMEKTNEMYILLGEFGWSDLGSWANLHELKEKDEHNNVVEANAILYDTSNSYVKVKGEKLVVVQGLDHYLINESENVLLICKIDSEKRFREFVSNAKKKGEEFI
ncbi:mannose-1-phosphate guanylyltransferase [Algoriphagus halophytocola]|uniref:Mannose-1-phosphate guanylyltransferase n=1 Tax=Algoriphagus halophytocola TaxID=2991499 RepID=A0ABY6MH24_9BACT|nr:MULTISPECIES: mannose-1-phosphate guanylyltransferase [unclassified Algoriphagus]UZD22498.1 mannose-1-phosphate guanylyltransferase [Algoriphagus sp. TR-M5]WBL43760.1 mannose-1-phosphate guanylyltransferase [Algoriphagus sp. TR-M9]